MNRRRFLAVAATGASALAGCNAIASPERKRTETPLPHRISGSACPDDTEWQYQWRFTLAVEGVR